MASASSKYLALLVLLAAAALLRPVAATPWIAPAVTPMGLLAINAKSPRPTAALGAAARANIHAKRGCTSIDDNVCGYISGLSNSSVACLKAATCVSFSSSYIGCCTESNIQECTDLITTCLPSASAIGCDLSCRATNSRVRYCTEPTAPVCFTYSFSSGVSGYACSSTSTVVSVSWAAEIFNICSTPSTQILVNPSTVYVPAAPTTPPPISAITTLAVQTAKPPTIPPGTIAGISLGAIAILALVGAGVFYFWFFARRRQAQQDPNPNPYHSAYAPYPGPPMSPAPPDQKPSAVVGVGTPYPGPPISPTTPSYGPQAVAGGGYIPQPQPQAGYGGSPRVVELQDGREREYQSGPPNVSPVYGDNPGEAVGLR